MWTEHEIETDESWRTWNWWKLKLIDTIDLKFHNMKN